MSVPCGGVALQVEPRLPQVCGVVVLVIVGSAEARMRDEIVAATGCEPAIADGLLLELELQPGQVVRHFRLAAGGQRSMHALAATLEVDRDALERRCATVAAAAAASPGSGNLGVVLIGDDHTRLRAALVGTALALYRYGVAQASGRRVVHVVGASAARACADASPLIDAVCVARDLVMMPANQLGPAELGPILANLAPDRVSVDVLDEAALARLGAGALVAVGAGAAEGRRAHLIRLTYLGAGGASPTVLVGKSVCFDAGGISLKQPDDLWQMKGDLAGGATAAAAVFGAAALALPIDVIALLPAVENLPDGRAHRPGDVVRTLAGKTVEIVDTDYEGRLVLADAFGYARAHCSPARLVSVATLSFAAVQVLGRHCAALFASDDRLAAELLTAGERAAERCCRLPLLPTFDSDMRSPVADLRNMAGHDCGATCFAGRFLEQFTGAIPWAHLDLLGPSVTGPGTLADPRVPQWATGFGVRMLLEWLTGAATSSRVPV